MTLADDPIGFLDFREVSRNFKKLYRVAKTCSIEKKLQVTRFDSEHARHTSPHGLLRSLRGKYLNQRRTPYSVFLNEKRGRSLTHIDEGAFRVLDAVIPSGFHDMRIHDTPPLVL